jgi:hypothetical protein
LRGACERADRVVSAEVLGAVVEVSAEVPAVAEASAAGVEAVGPAPGLRVTEVSAIGSPTMRGLRLRGLSRESPRRRLMQTSNSLSVYVRKYTFLNDESGFLPR